MRYSMLLGDYEVVVLLTPLYEQVFAGDQVGLAHRTCRVGDLLLVERHAAALHHLAALALRGEDLRLLGAEIHERQPQLGAGDAELRHALEHLQQGLFVYFAQRLRRRAAEEDRRVSNNKDNPAEIQMQRRLDGFMSYIAEEYNNLVIHEVILNKSDQESNQQTLDEFFRAHPKAALGVVFNSRVYQLGEYLRHAGRSMKGLIGYDLLKANVELLKSGDVHYLIGQRPGLQGYCGVKALCDHVVFKKSVEPVKYMPIDILIKENIDFYFEFV